MTKPASIAEIIAAVARETRAPDSLTEQVRALFAGKGLDLDADGTPYAEAIAQTFACDAQLRESSARAREQVAALQDRLTRLGRAWEANVAQLSTLHARLRAVGAALHEQAEGLARRRATVPGPREVQ